MATFTETINKLIADRNALAAHTSDTSPAAGQYVWTAIDDINDEIDELVANALADAAYVPQTDPFKSTTDASKQFMSTLNNIKSVFSTVDTVVAAIMDVISIILVL